MARSKLGNDPFLRGAAAPEPEASPGAAPPRPAAADARTGGKPGKAKGKSAAAKPNKTRAPRASATKRAPRSRAQVPAAHDGQATLSPGPAVSDVPATSSAPDAAAPRLRVSLPVLDASVTMDRFTFEADYAPAEPARPSREEVDPFGRDPALERRAMRLLEVVYRRYFRVKARGLENVPDSGPVLLVANHSGPLPWDSAMLKCALALEHPARRSVRPLAENFVFHFPFLGTFLNRLGAVRACQENAEALLGAGEAVAVFPEGMKGLGKHFKKRYHLQRFGRGGFVKLALRTKTPIIPVAIVGAEETHPLIGRIGKTMAPFGLPFLPVTPTFPLLGPLGLLPLPSQWIIEFGEPLHLPEDTPTDELNIARFTEDVRNDIQGRIDRLLAQRRSVFF